jgi:hypothetical protein
MRRLERYCALGGVASVEGLALERVPGIHVGDRPHIPDQWHPARVTEAVRARLMAAWGGLSRAPAALVAPDAGCAVGPARAVEVVQRREAPPNN